MAAIQNLELGVSITALASGFNRVVVQSATSFPLIRRQPAHRSNRISTTKGDAYLLPPRSSATSKLCRRSHIAAKLPAAHFKSSTFANTIASPVVTPIAFAAFPPLITTATQPFGVR